MLYVSRSKSKIGEKEVVFCRKNFLACHLFLWPLSLDCPAGSIEVLRYTVQWLEYGAAGEWSWEEALWDRTFSVWVNPLNLLFIWIIVPPFLGTMREKLTFLVNFTLPYKTGHFGLGESSWSFIHLDYRPTLFRDDEREMNILRNKPLRRLSFTLPYKTGHFLITDDISVGMIRFGT